MEPVVALEIEGRKRPPDSTQSKSAVDGPGFLPVIDQRRNKRESKSIVPKQPMLDVSDDSDTSTTNID